MAQKLTDSTRGKSLSLATDVVGDYLLKPNGKKHYYLATAITAGSTATTAATGSTAETSHATGRATAAFVSNGTNWVASA